MLKKKNLISFYLFVFALNINEQSEEPVAQKKLLCLPALNWLNNQLTNVDTAYLSKTNSVIKIQL